jgi:hypothetical protein
MGQAEIKRDKQKVLEAAAKQQEPLVTPTTEETASAEVRNLETTPTPITEELLQNLVRKHSDIFMSRFPKIQLRVFRTWSGRPPMDDVPEELRPLHEPTPVSGFFMNIGRDYRIGINKNLIISAQVVAFFHEYGHARYRREANEQIDNEGALIKTETAALLSSLQLADAEGLPEVAYLAVDIARKAASMGSVYQTAMDKVQTDPLWEKYSNRPND